MSAPKPVRKRRPAPAPEPAVLQVMPAKRVRLDPTLVPHVATFLLAMARPWVRALHRESNEKTELERKRRANHDAHLRSRIRAVQEIIGRLYDTVSVEAVDASREFVAAALTDLVEAADRRDDDRP